MYLSHIYLLYWLEKPLLLLWYSKSTQVEFWTNVSRTDTPSMAFFQMSTDAPARLDSWHPGCVRNVTRLVVARNNMITWSYRGIKETQISHIWTWQVLRYLSGAFSRLENEVECPGMLTLSSKLEWAATWGWHEAQACLIGGGGCGGGLTIWIISLESFHARKAQIILDRVLTAPEAAAPAVAIKPKLLNVMKVPHSFVFFLQWE